jgi:hypothetical protein
MDGPTKKKAPLGAFFFKDRAASIVFHPLDIG